MSSKRSSRISERTSDQISAAPRLAQSQNRVGESPVAPRRAEAFVTHFGRAAVAAMILLSSLCRSRKDNLNALRADAKERAVRLLAGAPSREAIISLFAAHGFPLARERTDIAAARGLTPVR